MPDLVDLIRQIEARGWYWQLRRIVCPSLPRQWQYEAGVHVYDDRMNWLDTRYGNSNTPEDALIAAFGAMVALNGKYQREPT